jgi:2,5-dichlorohydroquinone reductive dechlorinase
VDDLAAHLEAGYGPWLCGTDYTLADIVWSISLYRLQWLGLASLWAGKPQVQDYAMRGYRRPSVSEQVIHFPTPMPPHTAEVP